MEAAIKREQSHANVKMEAAIKREQSHAMHELCRALAGSMGNIKKGKKSRKGKHQERENIKKK